MQKRQPSRLNPFHGPVYLTRRSKRRLPKRIPVEVKIPIKVKEIELAVDENAPELEEFTLISPDGEKGILLVDTEDETILTEDLSNKKKKRHRKREEEVNKDDSGTSN